MLSVSSRVFTAILQWCECTVWNAGAMYCTMLRHVCNVSITCRAAFSSTEAKDERSMRINHNKAQRVSVEKADVMTAH